MSFLKATILDAPIPIFFSQITLPLNSLSFLHSPLLNCASCSSCLLDIWQVQAAWWHSSFFLVRPSVSRGGFCCDLTLYIVLVSRSGGEGSQCGSFPIVFLLLTGHTGHFCTFRRFRDSWEWKSLETPIQTSHHMCQIFRFSQLWFQPGIIELPRLSTELPLTLIHGTRTSAFSAWSLQDLRVLVNHWNIFGSHTSCSVVHWLHSALWWTLCRDQCNSIMAIYFHYALTYQPASFPTFQATD